ncbi:hypothetical protein ACHQM5_021560 [Ranunculus cassubicifolius]
MATTNTSMTENVLSVKLLIDSKAKRVIFAEAEKSVIDFLFSLLSLPLGSVTELVSKKNMVGSMGNIFESVESISATYIQPNMDKNSLLRPRLVLPAGNIPLLPPSIGEGGAKFYKCYSCSNYITNFLGTSCPACRVQMQSVVNYVAGGGALNAGSINAGGYVKGVVTYMVTDEMNIMPMSTISSITLLKKFNVADVSCLEEQIVDFGMKEGLEVLKAALISKTVLTDVFIGGKVKRERE